MNMIKYLIITLSIASGVYAPLAQAISAIGFGDSITQGYQRSQAGGTPYACAHEDLGNRNTNCGYINELTNLLGQSGDSSKIYNWGWHGEAVTFKNVNEGNYNFSSGVDRFRKTIDIISGQGVGYALIMEGTNDLPRGSSSEQIRDGLEAMINYSKSKNIIPVIATVPPRTDHRRNDSKLLELNGYIKTLATTHNIPLADQYSALGGLSGFSSFTSGDDLHVNDSGYQRMAQEWFNALKSSSGGGGDKSNSHAVPTLILPLLLDE